MKGWEVGRMNRGFLRAFFPEHKREELDSEPIIDRSLKPLYETALKHEEIDEKSRGEQDE
jgi:hypothetical protein